MTRIDDGPEHQRNSREEEMTAHPPEAEVLPKVSASVTEELERKDWPTTLAYLQSKRLLSEVRAPEASELNGAGEELVSALLSDPNSVGVDDHLLALSRHVLDNHDVTSRVRYWRALAFKAKGLPSQAADELHACEPEGISAYAGELLIFLKEAGRVEESQKLIADLGELPEQS